MARGVQPSLEQLEDELLAEVYSLGIESARNSLQAARLAREINELRGRRDLKRASAVAG